MRWAYYPDLRIKYGRMERRVRILGRQKELSNRIELIMGFGELSEKLNARGEIKFEKQSEKLIDKKRSGGFYRQFRRKARREAFSKKTDMRFRDAWGGIGAVCDRRGIGDRVSQGIGDFGQFRKRGEQSNLSEQRDAEERMLGNAELGGAVMS